MDFGDFTITKREIVFGVVILAIMLIFGFMIHSSIDNALMLKHQEYNTALRIDNDANMFGYAMDTNVGNAYVYGTVRAVDPVTFEEIGGQYSSVEKVKERYTKHTRTVTIYDEDGNAVGTRTEEYWTWDVIDGWKRTSSEIEFLERIFPYGAISFPGRGYITAIQESSKIRYKYYGAPVEFEATIYADLREGTLNDTRTYHNYTIEEAYEIMTSKTELLLFWFFWIILICGVEYGFIYFDNHWLEDKGENRNGNKTRFGYW